MDADDVVRALAALIACDDRATAQRIAAALPPFLDLVDCVRASDGAMYLAQVLDEYRRAHPQPVIAQIVGKDFSDTSTQSVQR